MEFKPVERLTPELNVTQLIDVVLLLLFFFMISTSFVTQPGLEVELPEAGTAGAHGQKELRVLLTESGQFYVQEKRVDPQQLRAELAAVLAGAGTAEEMVLVIKADQRVRHGSVVYVMDVARALGITQLAIATRPAAGVEAQP